VPGISAAGTGGATSAAPARSAPDPDWRPASRQAAASFAFQALCRSEGKQGQAAGHLRLVQVRAGLA
jgi:hypothetical protein